MLPLHPLKRSDAKALIRDLSPSEPAKELVSFVLDRSEGVPLYIEELTRSALEIGLPADAALSAHTAGKSISSNLQSLLLARLDRLGPAKEIAQMAATIGRDFDVELLRGASGWPEGAVRRELSHLIESGLIVERSGAGNDYAFTHSLLQQAAHQTMLRDRRERLHATIGALIEKRDPEARDKYPELLALHFSEAGDHQRAARNWLRAGTKAGQTWAKAEAAQMLSKGIKSAERLPPSTERDQLVLQLELERGDVLSMAFGYLTGQSSDAYHRALQLSEELDDPVASIRALDGLFGIHFNSGQFHEALGAGEQLITIGKARGNRRALVLGQQFKGMNLFSQGAFEASRDYLVSALEAKRYANEVGSDFPSMALIYLSWATHILGQPSEALALFSQAERHIVRRKSPYRLAQCLGNGCILFAFRDEIASIARMSEELLPLAESNGFNLWAKMAEFFKGWVMANTDGSRAGTELMQNLR